MTSKQNNKTSQGNNYKSQDCCQRWTLRRKPALGCKPARLACRRCAFREKHADGASDNPSKLYLLPPERFIAYMFSDRYSKKMQQNFSILLHFSEIQQSWYHSCQNHRNSAIFYGENLTKKLSIAKYAVNFENQQKLRRFLQ